MFCKSCGEKIENPNAAICVKCGVEKGRGNKFCPTCGVASQNPNAEICLSCGVQMNMKGNVSPNETLTKKFCPYCGAEVNPNAEICLTCGVNVKDSNKQGIRKFCMDCATPISNSNAEICLGCGVKFSNSNRMLASTGAASDKFHVNKDVGELSLFGHFINTLKNYANAKGRASRKEFWSFCMFFSIFSFGTLFAAVLAYEMWLWRIDGLLAIVWYVINFGLLAPSICVAIRRMHDTGRNGWFCLIPFANIVFAVEESKPGDNQYGPNPYGDNY